MIFILFFNIKTWKNMEILWLQLLAIISVLSVGGCVELAGRKDIHRMDVVEGETLTLTCNARSKLLRSYRWVYIREGTRKPRVLSSGRRLVVGETRLSIDAEFDDAGPVRLILKLKEIRPHEAGLFMCWRQGLKPDPQVFVRVLKSGTTEAEPISVEISAPSHVDYGGSATINCLIRPSWPGKVLWYKDGREISSLDPVHTQKVEEKPEGDLLASLDVVSVREDASYTCKVPSNPEAEATFNLVVRVARIEKLESTPDKDEIEYGETLSFDCLVSGTDEEILWLKDGNNLVMDEHDGHLQKEDKVIEEGKVRSKLVIRNFTFGDNGHYVCYVPGDSKGVLVNIEGRLPRVLSVKGWDFIVGDVLRLTCSTQYAKGEKNVTWLFEGKPLRTDWWAENVVRDDSHNTTHHDLSLPIPTRGHVGSYTCYTNYGSASTIVKEIVLPFVEESPPRSIEVPEGRKLSLPCSIAGYPVPTVLWEKNINGQWKIVEEAGAEGDPEVEGIEVLTEPLVDKNKRVGERQELLMAEAFPFHAGEYRCRGYNEEASTLVETEVTTVAPAPSILEVHSDPVMEGEDMKITCSVINWDGPVKFVKGFRVLGNDGDPRFESHLISKEEQTPEEEGEESLNKDGRRRRPRPVVYSHALVISDVTLADEGIYVCHAGPDESKSAFVTVNVVPPEVVGVAASLAVVGSEVFVSCTVTNMPLDEEVVFYFDGKSLSEEDDPRYSIHLAEQTGELIVNGKGRAKQATHVLKIMRATEEDSGVYHCRVAPDAEGSVTLQVQALEDVEEVSLEANSPYVGGDLILKCSVVNWDREVTFFLNQTTLLAEEDARFYLSRKHEGNATVHSLMIFDVTPDDSGFYQCFTSPIISAEANVTVKELVDVSVELEQRPKGTPIWVRSSLVLDCRVHGFKDHNHTIEFSHQGRPYLYFDSTITGPQVNQRASLLTEYDEEDPDDLDPGELSFRMKLDSVNENDGGMWVCRAAIPQAGFAQEALVNVEIFEPPKFTEFPDSEIFVEYGSDVILNCIVSGSPVPSVRWFKEGVPEPFVQNETGFARLELNGFEGKDAGTYVCEASSFDHVITSLTKLDVIRELKFIEMPDPQTTLVEGSPAVLRCMALSSPPSENPVVTWARKGTDEVLASGYEMASYTIEDPSESDAGEYVCKAVIPGAQEIISTEVIITRKTSVQTSQLPSSTMAPTLMSGRLVEISGPDMVEEGDTMTLMCLVSPLLAYYKYLTILNGTILTFEDKLSVQDPRMSLAIGKGGVGETLLRLTIRDVALSDQGNYECTVNTEPIARHSHFVVVVPDGSITTSMDQKTIQTGTPKGTSSSSKSTSGTPEGTSPYAFDRDSVTTHSPSASTFDVPSTFGPTYPIPYEPEEAPKNISKTVISGNSVTLPCTLLGNKESPIIWQQEKNDFLLAIDLFLQKQNERRFDIDAPDDFTRNLIIHEARTEDSGAYTCLKETSPQSKIHVELYVLESMQEPSSSQGTTEFFYLYTPSAPFEREDDGEVTEEPETKEESDLRPDLGTVGKEMEKEDGETTTYSYFDEEEKEMIEEDKHLDTNRVETTETPHLVNEKKIEEDIHVHSEADITEAPYFKEKEAEDSSEESEEETGKGEDIPLLPDREEDYDGKKSDVFKEKEDYEEGEEEEEEVHEHPEEEPEEPVEPTDTDTFEEPEAEVDLDSILTTSEPPLHSEKDSTNATESEIAESKEILEDRILNETLPPLEADSEKSNTTEDEHDIDTIDQAPDSDYPEEHHNETDAIKPQNEIGSTSTAGMVDTTNPQLFSTTSYVPPSTEPSVQTEGSPETESTVATPVERERETAPMTEELPDVEDEDETPEEEIDSGTHDVSTTLSPIEGVKTTMWSSSDHEDDDVTPDPFRGDRTLVKLDGSEFATEAPVFSGDSDVIAKSDYDDVEDPSDVIVKSDYDDVEDPSDVIDKLDYDDVEDPSDVIDKSDYDDVEDPSDVIDKSDYDDVGETSDVINGTDYYYYTNYDDVSSTPKPEDEIPVIIAEPGDRVEALPETEVVLPCPTEAVPEDITWKGMETLLFLGSLDLAGVEGLVLSPEGQLRLLSGVSDTKDDKTYTCYVFNYDTYEDELVASYFIELNKGEPLRTTPQSEKEPATNGTTVPPTSTYEFPGLEWQEVAVISNSKVSGRSLEEVLREGGLNAVLIEVMRCQSSDKIKGWVQAQKVLKECESKARDFKLIRSSQSVFIMLDFTVNLGLDLQLQYGSTLIYVHNLAVNLTAHVFGPLVPLNGYTTVECGSPVYSPQKDNPNVLSFCKSSVASTLLKLQEAYLSHSRKLPMA